MMKTSDSDAASSSSANEEVKYRGVRKRKWGKWVSEVRLPNSRERIWLGSYDSPRKAARAFDAAALCLRGSQARLNFPENPPQIPSNSRIMNHQQIQTVAAQHANSLVDSPQLPSSPLPPTEETETSRELSGEVLMETTEEWPFTEMMMMRDQFLGIDDDFMYDFDIPHVGPTTDAPADDGGSGFGTNSYLWNF